MVCRRNIMVVSMSISPCRTLKQNAYTAALQLVCEVRRVKSRENNTYVPSFHLEVRTWESLLFMAGNRDLCHRRTFVSSPVNTVGVGKQIAKAKIKTKDPNAHLLLLLLAPFSYLTRIAAKHIMNFHLAFIASALTARTATSFAPTVGRQSVRGLARATVPQMSSSDDTITLGIFGGGTVGGGIVEILSKKREYFRKLSGKTIEVKKICVRDASKPRDFALPEGCSIVTSYDDILDDDDIDVAVEVMGGTTDAKGVVMGALQRGKSVVTANKALIAKDLAEIEDVVASLDPGTQFRYEAAVCGGIPIIRSMQSDFVGDDINLMSGIINGCTNFMLTAMDRDGKSYDEALSEASDLGYAEADPTLDVGGFDARSKLKILIRLAYGMDIDEEDISCRGITELTKIDFGYAKTLGGTIKLLGVAEKNPATGEISAYVSPCYVTSDDPLASVSGATNAIEVISDNLVSSIYIGQGAGRYPTANSCINDIVALAKGDKTQSPFNPKDNSGKFANNYESVFFLRLSYRDQVGITRQVGEVCEKHGVSIHSLLQNPIAKNQESAFAIVTEKVQYASIIKVIAEIEALNWCKGKPFYMPVLREDWQQV